MFYSFMRLNWHIETGRVMGLFDIVRYKGKDFQSKDTPEQTMEIYEIRAGELWFRKAERKWRESQFGGFLDEISHEWQFCENFSGPVHFYREDKENGGYRANRWIEYRAVFESGKIVEFERLSRDKAIS